jgi:hypothetical protein
VDPNTKQPVQVVLELDPTGAAGALLQGQTQAAAIGGTAVLQKATLRAKPGEYQLVVTALNAHLVSCAKSSAVRALQLLRAGLQLLSGHAFI